MKQTKETIEPLYCYLAYFLCAAVMIYDYSVAMASARFSERDPIVIGDMDKKHMFFLTIFHLSRVTLKNIKFKA